MSSSCLAARRRLLPVSLLLTCFAVLTGSLLLPAASSAEVSPPRFEEALPGFKVARVLWREGKLVLEHQGRFWVLRPGDGLPGLPLVKLVEINERGAVLRDASSSAQKESAKAGQGGAAAAAAPTLMPDRLIKLERIPDSEAFSVVVLSATAPPAPAPLVEGPLGVQIITPEGVSKPATSEGHLAPLVPATQTGGGGGR